MQSGDCCLFPRSSAATAIAAIFPRRCRPATPAGNVIAAAKFGDGPGQNRASESRFDIFARLPEHQALRPARALETLLAAGNRNTTSRAVPRSKHGPA